MSVLPSKVKVVEVGVRDGLQNEATIVPTEIKLALIDRLLAAGLRNIEAAAFVSPKWVPQMADHDQLVPQLSRYPNVSFSALTPNRKGLDELPLLLRTRS